MNDSYLKAIASAYEAGGIGFIDESVLNIEEARKDFKKDLKKRKVKYDEKIFKAHYTSAKIDLLSGLFQYYPVLTDEPKRKEIVNKMYEVVKELYENENKESDK